MADKENEKIDKNVVKEKVLEMEQKLKEWNEKRLRVIEELRAIAREVGDWTFGTSVSKIVGSSVGFAGGVALLGGILFPPLAIGGLLLGAAGGVSNIATGVAQNVHLKDKAERVQFLLKNEINDFEKLVSGRENLLRLIQKYQKFDPFRDIKPDEIITKLFSRFGQFAGKEMAKIILKPAVFIAMSSDVISIVENVDIIANKVPNEFGAKVYQLSVELENHRKDVMAKFME